MASDASIIASYKTIQNEAIETELRAVSLRDKMQDLSYRLSSGDSSLTVEEAQQLYNQYLNERNDIRSYWNNTVLKNVIAANREFTSSLWVGAEAKNQREAAVNSINSMTAVMNSVSILRDNIPGLISKLEANQKNNDAAADAASDSANPNADAAKNDPPPNTQPAQNDLGGQSTDDDSGNPNADAAKNDPASADNSGTPTTTAGAAGTAGAEAKNAEDAFPKRPYNPLAKFSSYTYNITLYMMSPDALNAFVKAGKKTIRGPNGTTLEGIFIVAQSGGINNNVSERPPGMTMDYYIDNLKFKSNLTGPGTTDASNVTNITFNIYEPNGFSFVTKLTNAAKIILSNSRLQGAKGLSAPNAMRQFFVLGISFAGYDSEGNVANANEFFTSDTVSVVNNQPVYERFFDIVITKMTFNLDGSMVNYSITASMANTKEAEGTKNGTLLDRTVARGSTVEEALLGPGGVIPFINEQQKKLFQEKKIKVPLVYDVVFVDHPYSKDIKDAMLITKEELQIMYKNKIAQIPMSDVKIVTEVNDKKSVNATPAKNTVKELTFQPNTAIGAVIKKLIQSSTYLADALTVVNTAQEQPKSNEDDSLDNQTPNEKPSKKLRWYSLGSQVEVIDFDEKTNDWGYKITYIISPFVTPCSTSMFASNTDAYHGPHKRYKYWFTGENTEIIRYSQAMNTAWYLAESGAAKGAAVAEQDPGRKVGQIVPGDKQGGINQSLDTQNSYITSLYAPGDWARAKIEIFGDPDYLMYDTPGSINEVYSLHYAGQKGFTINPNGGQVFVEIDFAEGVDYNHGADGTYVNDGNYDDTGLMQVNRSILFWKYPDELTKGPKKIQGISYLVISVESTFSKGKFTQVLEMSINTFSKYKKTSDAAAKKDTQRDPYINETKKFNRQAGNSDRDTDVNESAKNNGSSDSSPAGGDGADKQIETQPTTPAGVSDDDGANARDMLMLRQRPWDNLDGSNARDQLLSRQSNQRAETVDEAFARSGLGGP